MLVHNRYVRAGGEDSVLETEKQVLLSHGHKIVEFLEDNKCIEGMSRTAAMAPLVWSVPQARRMAAFIDEHRPDLVHIHNLYYRIGPAIYYVCKQKGLPVVQTLHNFRMGCINARLSRNGIPCELCLDRRVRWPGILNRCFQDSMLKSGALTLAMDLHRSLGSWRRTVDVYIALTEFARIKHIAGGVPESKIVVKPNTLSSDPGVGSGDGGYCLFVGRLDSDKGIEVLLAGIDGLPQDTELWIVGTGPMSSLVEAACRRKPRVRWLGAQSRKEVLRLMQGAQLLLFPTLAYENCPVVVAEAFATGLPIVASDLGATRELVQDGFTGALFRVGSALELGAAATRLLADQPLLARMRRAARAEFERKFTPERCYADLMRIYEVATERNRDVLRRRPGWTESERRRACQFER
jgi:glycosyltransferase involved in cell wall biosynthesis